VNLISGGVLALLHNPDQLAALRADPSLIGRAVEDFVRYDDPVEVLLPVDDRGRDVVIPGGGRR